MGSSNIKKLQVVALLGVASFMALGFTVVQRGFQEITRLGTATFKAMGPQAKQMRSVQEFDRIEAGSVYEVDVTFGARPSVTLEGPKDLLPILTSSVHGGTLELGASREFNLSGNDHIRAHVVTRSLKSAKISGAGRMVINGKIREAQFDGTASGASTLRLSAEVETLRLDLSGASKTSIDSLGARKLNVEASGAANLSVNGMVDASSIEASGAANIKGRLTSNSADVQTSGASHASLRVINSLKGDASGASSISYSGRPGHVSKQTSGVSSINHEN